MGSGNTKDGCREWEGRKRSVKDVMHSKNRVAFLGNAEKITMEKVNKYQSNKERKSSL